MRKLGLILGISSVLVFIAYYQHAYANILNLNYFYSDITNMVIYVTMAAAFYNLGKSQGDMVRILVYNAIAEFWLFLTAAYLLNYFFDEQIVLHKVILAIVLTFITSLIWFCRKLL